MPISRERGDIGATRTAWRLLDEGKAVLMFPEGTRSLDGQLQQPRAGVGMIAARAKVPIVPMRIFGTDRALPKGASLPRPARVEIKFGEPFTYPLPAHFEEKRGEAVKAAYFEIGREIMRRIAALKPEQE